MGDTLRHVLAFSSSSTQNRFSFNTNRPVAKTELPKFANNELTWVESRDSKLQRGIRYKMCSVTQRGVGKIRTPFEPHSLAKLAALTCRLFRLPADGNRARLALTRPSIRIGALTANR